MQLYLIRHAEAVNASLVHSDAERPLTENGVTQMRKYAKALRRLGVELDAVLTSPFCRALQTAEILCDVLKCPDILKTCDELQAGCTLETVLPILRKYQTAEAVALVGHNPDLELIAGGLIAPSAEAAIVFKKGAVCRIDVDTFSPRPVAVLIWHLPPKVLQMLGE